MLTHSLVALTRSWCSRERFGHLPAVDLVQGDITDMNTLPDGGYDIVFDEVTPIHMHMLYPLAPYPRAPLPLSLVPP